jgi:hypothetical protein
MTPAEVAAVVRVPERTLTYWRTLEEGPMFVKIGKYCRYDTAEVRAFVAHPRRYNAKRRIYDDLDAYQHATRAAA